MISPLLVQNGREFLTDSLGCPLHGTTQPVSPGVGTRLGYHVNPPIPCPWHTAEARLVRHHLSTTDGQGITPAASNARGATLQPTSL